MRVTRLAQTSIFDNYSEHEFGQQLKSISCQLDKYPDILLIIEDDLIDFSCKEVGRSGLTVENIFRCYLLKQILQVSYRKLDFHLSDSMTYRTFARLPPHISPSRSTLQSTIRSIRPETMEAVFEHLNIAWLETGEISLQKVRIDSTVAPSNIADPADSQLLSDCVRVLSRLLAKSGDKTGTKIKFTDKRKDAKSEARKIFYAKKAEKDATYPELLKITKLALRQSERGISQVREHGTPNHETEKWLTEVEHYCDLTRKVIYQTECRVLSGETVPANIKIVSIFETHVDIICKGGRETQFGHKINVSTDQSGMITHLSIEDGNPSDVEKYIPILEGHMEIYEAVPKTTACDGGYASIDNVYEGNIFGVEQSVFHKTKGISLRDMGVVGKTFRRLRDFRAGVEGNISELKRAFGLKKVTWKGLDGFKSFVWGSVICYNLTRLARIDTA